VNIPTQAKIRLEWATRRAFNCSELDFGLAQAARRRENCVAMSKVKAPKLFEFEGLSIHAILHKAKRTGRDRVWIQIRQQQPKKWHVSTTLSYAQGLDVQFQREMEK
jgi:hypothetical protein